MPVDSRVLEALLRYESLVEQGRTPSAVDLCPDCPELADDVRRRLEGLRALDAMLTGTPAGPPGGAAPSARPPGYDLLRELGRGGMGVVYLARQRSLNRPVALKMVLSGAHAGARELARFKAEAEAVARLAHPNIVQVHDVGEHDGHPYLAMEYVEGPSLAQRLAGTPLPAREAAELVQTLARAVHAAHERGVIHRDLKPANVLLQESSTAKAPRAPRPEEKRMEGRGSRIEDRGGEPPPLLDPPSSILDPPFSSSLGALGDLAVSSFVPKVTDFGLAKQVGGGDSLTPTGAVLGTPSYMAPEQAAGAKGVGPAADVYALGAILYECLTGRPPFKGETAADTLMQVLGDDPVPPRRLAPKVPRDLETVCLKCLEKDPAKRYPSARALADDLGRFLAGEPILARPVGPGGRLLKWARRRPALAAVTSLLAASVLVGLVVVTALWQRAEAALGDARSARAAEEGERRKAEAARTEVEGQKRVVEGALAKARVAEREQGKARKEAEKQKQEALSALGRERRTSYYHGITLAHREWQANNSSEAERLLARPDARLRGWEWHYLRRLCSSHLVGFRVNAHRYPDGGLSPDGRYLAVTGLRNDKNPRVNGGITLWDTRTLRLARVFDPEAGPQTSVLYTPDGRRLVSAGTDGAVRVWDASTGRVVRTIPAKLGPIQRLALSPDGRYVAAGGERPSAGKVEALIDAVRWVRGDALTGPGGRAGVWEVDTGKEVSTFRGHTGSVAGLAFSPDGGLLASAGGRAVRLWERATGREVRVLRPAGGMTFAASFSPDGTLLAAGAGATVKLYDARSGAEVATLSGPRSAVLDVAFSPDGQWLAAGTMDPTVAVWDVATRRLTRVYLGQPAYVRRVHYTPDGHGLFAATTEGAVTLWDATASQEARGLRAGAGWVHAVAYSPDGKRVAAATGRDIFRRNPENEVKVWDSATGAEMLALRAAGDFHAVAFSPDGQRVAGAGTGDPRDMDNDGHVRVWDVATGRRLFHALHPGGTVKAVAFSPDGTTLASAGMRPSGSGKGRPNAEVRLWDAKTGAARGALPGHADDISSLAYSPDGRWLASGSSDGTVKVWDVARRRERLTFEEHRKTVLAVAFGPGGRVASADSGGVIHVWEAATGKVLLGVRAPEKAHAISFSRDGRRLASAHHDGAVRVWDAATGHVLLTLRGGPEPPFADRAAPRPPAEAVGSRQKAGGSSFADRAAPRPPAEVRPVVLRPEGKPPVKAPPRPARQPDTIDVYSILNMAGGGSYHVVLAVAFSPTGTHLASGGMDGVVRLWDAEEVSAESRLRRLKDFGRRAGAWHRAEAWRALGLGRRFAADFHLGRALALAPEDGAARARVGEVRLALGETDKALAEFDKAVGLAPALAAGWRGRAEAHARLGRWDRAAADLGRAVKAGADEVAVWHERALACLGAGDQTGYRKVCQTMLERFGRDTDPAVRRRVAWTCGLAPGALDDLAPVVRLAEESPKARSPSDRQRLVIGAALYRAGRHRDALRQLDGARFKPKNERLFEPAWLALAYAQLGQARQARGWLKEAEERLAALERQRGEAPAAFSWVDHATLRLLVQEARALLKSTKAGAPRAPAPFALTVPLPPL